MNGTTVSTALLAFAVLFAPASPVSAQVLHGLHVGPGSSTLSGEGVQRAFQPSGGASIDFPVSGGIGLRIGAFYTSRGARFDALPWGVVRAEQQGGGIADARLFMDYIEFPALLRIGSPSGLVLIGPVIGFRINCSVDAEEFNLEKGVDLKCHDDFNASVRSRDVGVTAGMGTSFFEHRDGSFVTAHVLYTTGLVGAFENADPVEGKHSAFAVLLGAAFPGCFFSRTCRTEPGS